MGKALSISDSSSYDSGVSDSGSEESTPPLSPTVVISPVIQSVIRANVEPFVPASGSTVPPNKKTKIQLVENAVTSKYVARPDFGAEGTLLPVFSNHFPLNIVDQLVYHYDMDIEVTRAVSHEDVDGCISRRGSGEAGFAARKLRKITYKVNREVVDQLVLFNSQEPKQLFYRLTPVYDGLKNMYTTKALSGITSESQQRYFVTLPDESEAGKVYAVSIKYVGQIDLNAVNLYYEGKIACIPPESIQVLDIILRHGPNTCRIPIGNCLYVDSSISPRVSIGSGREIAFGFYQSVRGCMSGANLVVDRSTTVFYPEGPLVSFVANLMRNNNYNGSPRYDDHRCLTYPMREIDRKRVERELKTLQIVVTHLTYKRKYRITGLTFQPAREVVFTYNRDGNAAGTVTVPEYFKLEYNISLQFPNLPCIVVGSNMNKKFLPMEVCDLVPNQTMRRKLTNDQLAQMIRTVGQQTPIERFGVIQDSVQAVMNDGQVFCQEFGVSVHSQPIVVGARVIHPPQLTYRSERDANVQPANGTWYLERDQRLFSPGQAVDDKWVLLNCTMNTSDEEAQVLIEMLTSKASEMGFGLRNPLKVARAGLYRPGMMAGLFDKAKKAVPGLKMIVFIVTGEEALYNDIKVVGDIVEGIPTQCIMEKNVRRLNPNLVANLILKMNTKMGGTNGILASNADKPAILCKSKPVMVIGADVTHPSNDRSAVSSVAALVGSYDADCSKYIASVRVQVKEKAEMIKDLDQMAVELLSKYKSENNGQLPDHVLIFRDGVSDGQFDQLLHQELGSFHSACEQMKRGYAPKVTLVVVQKRHHTRFIPCEEQRGVGRNRNIPPGTVIDTECIHPTDFDFYLCSHVGVQGTSRPTHYYVIWDDNEFRSDELQKLTYYLCHVYAKCNRSISIPAAVQYAHLAAYRARVHLIGVFGSEMRAHMDSTDRLRRLDKDSEQGKRERQKLALDYSELVRVQHEIGKLMYFC